MKTGTGIEIKPEDLTMTFVYAGKRVRIGKFDPSSYPELLSDFNIEEQKYAQCIFDQLEDSGAFTKEELENLCWFNQKEFAACICPM